MSRFNQLCTGSEMTDLRALVSTTGQRSPPRVAKKVVVGKCMCYSWGIAVTPPDGGLEVATFTRNVPGTLTGSMLRVIKTPRADAATDSGTYAGTP